MHWIHVIKHWRLNERMYGALQGLNKAETAAKHGEQQVAIWRRSYDIPPPAIETSDPRWPGNEAKYHLLDQSVIPRTECLKDTVARVLPFWYDSIVPAIKEGKNVLVATHGNSIRALLKYLDNIPDEDISKLNIIPTGFPLVYEFDKHMKPLKHYYLANEKEISAAIGKVAAQENEKIQEQL